MTTTQVLFVSSLRGFTAGEVRSQIEGRTLSEVLIAAGKRYAALEPVLFDDNGAVRPFVRVFLNGALVADPAAFTKPLPKEAQVVLVPLVAGGAGTVGPFTNEEIERYSRNLLLKEIGVKGQKKLKNARVAVVGLGALGSPVVQYLAAAGVGTLVLIDKDKVELTNLQRQVLHGTRDVKRPKIASARDKVRALNPGVKLELVGEAVTTENILETLQGATVVVDATDGFHSRYLVSDAAAVLGIPEVFGAFFQTEGLATVFSPNGVLTLRSLWPEPPAPGLVPTCAAGGAFGPLAGILGSVMAAEVIKLVLGAPDTLLGRLLLVDAWRMTFRELSIAAAPNEAEPHLRSEDEYAALCGEKTDQCEEVPIPSLTPKELKQLLDDKAEVQLFDVREPHERAAVKFPGAVVMPIGQIVRRINEFNPKARVVFICREGQRSILAARTLLAGGFTGQVFNLADGMRGWARDVDPSLPVL